jgi:hypothetical protein
MLATSDQVTETARVPSPSSKEGGSLRLLRLTVLAITCSVILAGCNAIPPLSGSWFGDDSTNANIDSTGPLTPVELTFVYDGNYRPVVTPDGSQLLVFTVEEVQVLGSKTPLATKVSIHELRPPYGITTLEIPGGAIPGVQFVEDGKYAMLSSPSFALASSLNLKEKKLEDYANLLPRGAVFSPSEELILGYTVENNGGFEESTPVLRGFLDSSRDTDFEQIQGYRVAFSKSGKMILILGTNLDNNRFGLYRATTEKPLEGQWIYLPQTPGNGSEEIAHLNQDGTAAVIEVIRSANYTYAVISTNLKENSPAFELSVDTSSASFSEEQIQFFNFFPSLIGDKQATFSSDARYLMGAGQVLDIKKGKLEWFGNNEPLSGQLITVDSLERSFWVDTSSLRVSEYLWESGEFGQSYDLAALPEAEFHELSVVGDLLIVLSYKTFPEEGKAVSAVATTINLAELVGQ